MHSLLDDHMIRMRENNGGVTKHTLPEVLHELTTKEHSHFSFPGLQSFQKGPWHAFLAQLGALVYHHFKVPSSVEDWREGLLYLTKGDEDPWHLVVEDFSKPAFMQPPNPTPTGETSSSPDFYSMLILAKEHVVKTRIVDNFELDLWVFGLIGEQTNRTYYVGPTHYGISRANGARHYLATRTFDNGLTRDIEAILNSRSRLVEMGFSENGCALLWLLSCPPKGQKSNILPSNLDPFYIEVCDNARLCNGIVALKVEGLSGNRVSKESWGDFWEIQVKGKQIGGEKNIHPIRVLGWLALGERGVCAKEPGTYMDYSCLVQAKDKKSQGYHQFQLPDLSGPPDTLFKQWASWGEYLKSGNEIFRVGLKPLKDYINTRTYQDTFDAEARKLFQDLFFQQQEDRDAEIFRYELGKLAMRIFRGVVNSVSAPAHKKYPITNKATAYLISEMKKRGLWSE